MRDKPKCGEGTKRHRLACFEQECQRLQTEKDELTRLQQHDPSAVRAYRESLRREYKKKLRKRVFVLNSDPAWPLAEALYRELKIDLRPWLRTLIERVMTPKRPKSPNGNVAIFH